MNFDAIIFDMDGVIVDSEPRHERAFREVFHELGKGDDHGIEFSDYFGKSDRALWVDFIAKHNPEPPLEQLMERKQRRFLEMIDRDRPIYAPLPSLVDRLAAVYKLAVASGSSHRVIDAVLAMDNLRGFFPVVVSAQDVRHGKPAPDIFLRAAELMGVDPAKCCVIEDSAAGVHAALAAGMTSIGITNSLPAARLAHAHHVVREYHEIASLLLPRRAAPAGTSVTA